MSNLEEVTFNVDGHFHRRNYEEFARTRRRTFNGGHDFSRGHPHEREKRKLTKSLSAETAVTNPRNRGGSLSTAQRNVRIYNNHEDMHFSSLVSSNQRNEIARSQDMKELGRSNSRTFGKSSLIDGTEIVHAGMCISPKLAVPVSMNEIRDKRQRKTKKTRLIKKVVLEEPCTKTCIPVQTMSSEEFEKLFIDMDTQQNEVAKTEEYVRKWRSKAAKTRGDSNLEQKHVSQAKEPHANLSEQKVGEKMQENQNDIAKTQAYVRKWRNNVSKTKGDSNHEIKDGAPATERHAISSADRRHVISKDAKDSHVRKRFNTRNTVSQASQQTNGAENYKNTSQPEVAYTTVHKNTKSLDSSDKNQGTLQLNNINVKMKKEDNGAGGEVEGTKKSKHFIDKSFYLAPISIDQEFPTASVIDVTDVMSALYKSWIIVTNCENGEQNECQCKCGVYSFETTNDAFRS